MLNPSKKKRDPPRDLPGSITVLVTFGCSSFHSSPWGEWWSGGHRKCRWVLGTVLWERDSETATYMERAHWWELESHTCKGVREGGLGRRGSWAVMRLQQESQMSLYGGLELGWPDSETPPELRQGCWALYPLTVQALDVGCLQGRQVTLGKAASFGQGNSWGESQPWAASRQHSWQLQGMTPWSKRRKFILLKYSWLTINLFYWSIVDWQCCINFCCTATWFSYTYVYILFHILFHYGLS